MTCDCLLFFALYYSGSGDSWIGLTKTDGKCSSQDPQLRRAGWTWEDGTPYSYSTWHDWNGDEPDNKDCCGYMKDSTTGWWGAPCRTGNSSYYGYSMYYICEKRTPMTTPTTASTAIAMAQTTIAGTYDTCTYIFIKC